MMSSQLSKVLKHAAGRLLFGFRIHKLFFKDRALVVAFHCINDNDDVTAYNCKSGQFVKYCQFLKSYFEVVPLDAIMAGLENGHVGGLAAITFDDGYKDNVTVAAPILHAMSLPATVYVITNELDEDKDPATASRLGPGCQWLRWDDARQLRSMNIEIGSHTMSHQNLAAIDVDDVVREVTGSRDAIARHLGAVPAHFAFPYGGPFNFSATASAAVRNAGYSSCASCYGGLVTAHTDPLNLPREPISNWYYSAYHFGFELLLRVLRGSAGLSSGHTKDWGK